MARTRCWTAHRGRNACKAAEHVPGMCIRALDDCPAIDITFEDDLRAIIIADVDLVPECRNGAPTC